MRPLARIRQNGVGAALSGSLSSAEELPGRLNKIATVGTRTNRRYSMQNGNSDEHPDFLYGCPAYDLHTFSL